jgi:hypothetical protein
MADNTAGQTKTVYVDQQCGQRAQGKVVFDATSITTTEYMRIECGFKPRKVRVLNLTSKIEGEYWEGMTSAQHLRTVANGTRTLDTTAASFSLDAQGFRVLQDGTLAYITASSDVYWEAVA